MLFKLQQRWKQQRQPQQHQQVISAVYKHFDSKTSYGLADRQVKHTSSSYLSAHQEKMERERERERDDLEHHGDDDDDDDDRDDLVERKTPKVRRHSASRHFIGNVARIFYL